jgi:hypothetical protein
MSGTGEELHQFFGAQGAPHGEGSRWDFGRGNSEVFLSPKMLDNRLGKIRYRVLPRLHTDR